jgi:hypothetical protein
MAPDWSRHRPLRARVRLAPIAIVASAGLVLTSCGSEEPASEPGAEAEAPVAAGDEAVSDEPGGADAQGGPQEPGDEPSEPAPEAATDESLENRPERLDQRIEQARELSDQIREAAEQLRETGDPTAFHDLAEQFGGGRDAGESPADYCRRLGAPERICGRLADGGE